MLVALAMDGRLGRLPAVTAGFVLVVVVVTVVVVRVLKAVVSGGPRIAARDAGRTGPEGWLGGSCERRPYSTYWNKKRS